MNISKSIKSIIIFLLVSATLIPAFSAFALYEYEETPIFTDTNMKAWYYESVFYCKIMGYMGGVGDERFDPHGSVTREQFVTVLANISGVDTAEYKNIPSGMADVPTGRWYSGAITWAVKEGYVSGISENRFGLGKKIDRASLAALLYRYAKKNGELTESTADLSIYADYNKLQPWMKEGLEWAVANSVITSADNKKLVLDPTGSATRAQAAVMLRSFDRAKGCVVSLCRNALKERIASDYQNPKPDLIERMSYEAYVTYTEESVPKQCGYIYDWYIDVILDKESRYAYDETAVLDLKNPDDLRVFMEFRNKMHSPTFGYHPEGLYIFVYRDELVEKSYESYNSYVSRIEAANAEIKSRFSDCPAPSEINIKWLCDDVEKMAVESGAVGKPEKEAVDCIINYLCNRVEFEHDALMGLCSSNAGYTLEYTACNNRAISYGYAKTFYAICYYLGLDAEYCTGSMGSGIPWAWNKVTIDTKTWCFDIARCNIDGSTDRYGWSSEELFDTEYTQKGSAIYAW
ncbi:MAG: S-layer homology domain-containing protein [Clostridia bacterium]|nr:S-layer homology domain-containing protein [Clostridia bacterium]